MVAPVFRESAFVWLCVALTGGCLAVAVAVWARKFLREVSEQFIRLSPSAKAVLAAAVVVATVFAQKPTNVSTNQHESARIEEVVSATPTEEPAYPPAKQPEGAARRGALNAEETEIGRRGGASFRMNPWPIWRDCWPKWAFLPSPDLVLFTAST